MHFKLCGLSSTMKRSKFSFFCFLCLSSLLQPELKRFLYPLSLWMCNVFVFFFLYTLTGTRCCGFSRYYDPHTRAYTSRESETLACNGECDTATRSRLLLYRKMKWMVGTRWMMHAITQTEKSAVENVRTNGWRMHAHGRPQKQKNSPKRWMKGRQTRWWWRWWRRRRRINEHLRTHFSLLLFSSLFFLHNAGSLKPPRNT